MYKVTLRDLNTKDAYPYLELLAENHEDLRAIVTLAPEAGYKIETVKQIRNPLQTVSEFLEEIKDKIKPKDLVFGVGTDGTNYTGDPSDEISLTNKNTNQKEN